MSNLTDLLPAGAGGKQVSFVASGTLSSGQTVALKTDGTVTAVALSTPALGGYNTFTSNTPNYMSSTSDVENNKVFISYSDAGNGSYGTVVIATVNGTSVSFGTPVVYNSGYTAKSSTAFDSQNNQIVVAYVDTANGSYGTAIVGTVSGTSVSFGSEAVFETTSTDDIAISYDTVNTKFVVFYREGSLGYGKVKIGTVSGTSISFGSIVTFNSGQASQISAVYDPVTEKVIVCYKDDTAYNGFGTALVGTVSGTSISFGSKNVFNSGTTFYTAVAYDSVSDKIVISYKDNSNNYYGTAVVGTVSGTSISFGAETVFISSEANWISTAYDSSNNKIVTSYQDQTNSNYAKISVGTVSGTSISFGSAITLNTSTSYYTAASYAGGGSVLISFQSQQSPTIGLSRVYNLGASNSADFIGITDAAISDTASGSVTIKGGISTNVTGLTANSTYYVQDDGSLSTTTSTVLAGKALSSTSINLDYTT